MKFKIKKKDTVIVITGNDKGKTGQVLEIYPETNRILVEQINIRKKHQKPNQKNQTGGIIQKEVPIHYSNVMILDGKKPSRIGIRVNAKGKKERFAIASGKTI